MQRDQYHIDQRPHAQAAKAEQLADALLPVPQIEAIRPEAAQRDADHQCRRPPDALRPVAAARLLEVPLAHAQQIGQHGTIGAARLQENCVKCVLY